MYFLVFYYTINIDILLTFQKTFIFIPSEYKCLGIQFHEKDSSICVSDSGKIQASKLNNFSITLDELAHHY